MKIYVDNGTYIAGMTLLDQSAPEKNNMALHSCKHPNLIIENRKKLATSLDCNLNDFVCSNQTHSANFYGVTHKDKGKGATDANTAIPDTDALYTYESDLLLCSFSADCVPVTFYNKVNGVIGVIHSGWRGTVQEISLKLFQHLIMEENSHPHDFHIQIGSALSQEKFEVEEDVYTQFQKLGYADDWIYYNPATQKYHIDNQLVVKKQCEIAGIPANQISVDRSCTYMSPKGFSYRRDKASGRHLIFIMKR